MSNKKVATLAMILALAGSTVAVKAADVEAAGYRPPSDDCKECVTSASACQTLTAKLCEFIKIVANGGVTSTCIKCDGNLENALTPKFKIETNTPAKVFLQAKVDTTTNHDADALYQQSGNKFILFGNTAAGHVPTMTAYNNCKSSSPTTGSNANIVSYPIQSVILTGDTTTTPAYDSMKNQYDLKVNAGTTNVTATIGAIHRANTYSNDDLAGSYKSEVIVTTASL